MKKKYVLGLVLLVVVLGVAIFLDPTRTLLGYLKGETFFQDRPSSYWLRSLASQDPAEQFAATSQLTDGGAEAIPILFEILNQIDPKKNEDFEIRWRTIALLGQVGEGSTEVQNLMIQLIDDSDPTIRGVAAHALSTIPDPTRKAMPALTKLLDSDFKVDALRGLSRYGPSTKDLLPTFRKLLKDIDSEVRWNAARTIEKIGKEAKDAVPDLVEQLKDPVSIVREHGAEALGKLGEVSSGAVPDLIRLLKDEDSHVRRDAARSLGQIGSAAKSAVPELVKLFEDPDKNVSSAAIGAVKILDPSQVKNPEKK